METTFMIYDITRTGKRAMLAIMLLTVAQAALAADFSAPWKITGGAKKYQLTRLANSIMAVDSEETLHVTYWAGGISTTPGSPSYVYCRSWSEKTGWSPEESIDNSTFGSSHVGGRHPSLTVAPDDTVWVVWHDHRNCIPLGNWINNVEIYGDRKPAGGSFSSSDIRLTTTAAQQYGDNGYTPKIAAHPDGRLSLAWYDYHFDYNVSDIFLALSDVNGAFPSLPMEEKRVTNLAERGNVPPFTVPDLALDSRGTRHLVWAGGAGAGVDLHYAEVPMNATRGAEANLAENVTDFFDPAHLMISAEDDVWILYADETIPGMENITLLPRPYPAESFLDPFAVSPVEARQYGMDGAIDSKGILHLVWVDERDGVWVYYAQYDPFKRALIREEKISPYDGPWARAAIHIDARDNIYILWEEDLSAQSGDIWFTTNYTEPTTSVTNWEQY